MLASCATVKQVQPQASPENPSVPVENRVTSLSNIQQWDLDALIAIRNNAKNDSGTANMKWQQSRNNYNIQLFGPLGSNSVKLSGHPGKVSMETSDGKKSSAQSPEMLLAAKTGWKIPVSNLYYWIRGLPVPDASAKKNYDNANRLSQLVQAGWTIRFQNYTAVNQVELPTKIFLANPELNVKIIVNHWQI
jgi:outer membrane lipoprotein LolB